MKLQIAGKELHYKPYNGLVLQSEELDGDCRCDVVRPWGVDAVRISTSDGKCSMTVYPEDIPAFLQAVREISSLLCVINDNKDNSDNAIGGLYGLKAQKEPSPGQSETSWSGTLGKMYPDGPRPAGARGNV